MITQEQTIQIIIALTEPQLLTLRSAFFVAEYPGHMPNKRRVVNQGVFSQLGHTTSVKALARRGLVALRDKLGRPLPMLTPLGWRIAYELGLLEAGRWVITPDGYVTQVIHAPFAAMQGVEIINRSSGMQYRLGVPVMNEAEVIVWQCWQHEPGSEPDYLSANDLRSFVALSTPNLIAGGALWLPGDRAIALDMEEVYAVTHTFNRATGAEYAQVKFVDGTSVMVFPRDKDYVSILNTVSDPLNWYIYMKRVDSTEYRLDKRGVARNQMLVNRLNMSQCVIQTSGQFYLFDAKNRCHWQIAADSVEAHTLRHVIVGWRFMQINEMVGMYSNPEYCFSGMNTTPVSSAFFFARDCVKITLKRSADGVVTLIQGHPVKGLSRFYVEQDSTTVHLVGLALLDLLKYAEWLYEDWGGGVITLERPHRWEHFLPLVGGWQHA